MVKTAIIKGLAEQYYSQERFKEDTPVCPWVEPTPEEILATWEEHTLDMEREQNMQMVKDMILASFGICISVDQVKLLTRFSKLRLIFVFDTYSWKHIHCFKSKPQHLPFAPTPTPEAGKEGSLKRKGTEDEVKMDQPASKCPTPSREGPRSKRREGRARSSSIPLNDTALSAISPAEASTATSSTARNERATTSPPAISSARSPTQTNATPNITMLPLAGKEPQFLIQPAYSKALSEGLTRTILISSWLRLLPSISVQSPETCRTIEIWLKDTFSIEVKWSDIIKMTDEARKDNLSPLNTGAFRGLVTANSAELGTMLMNPCRPTRDEKARRGSLVLMSGHVNEAMCQAGKSSGVGLRC